MSDDTTNVVGGININDLVPSGGTPTFTNIYDTGIAINDIVISGAANLLTGSALTNGQLLIGSTLAAPVAASLTGTTNEIIVTPGAGSITLSTPQAIAITSSPTFVNAFLTGVTQDNTQTNLLALNGSNELNTVAVSSLPVVNPFNQSLNTTNSPTFANLTLTSGYVSSVAGTANEIIASSATGAVTLSTPQAIATTSSPTFANLTLTSGYVSAIHGTASEVIVSANTGSITLSTPQPLDTISSPTFIDISLTSVPNDNTQTSILAVNPSGQIVYRTASTLPAGNPFNQSLNTNNNPTFQTLTLSGVANSVYYLQTGGVLGYAGSNSTWFSNSAANDIVLQQTNSSHNLLLGVGTAAQLIISNTVTTNNTYIRGGLTPSIAVQTAAGTGASASISASSQQGGFFTITAGSIGTTTTGQLAIITLPLATPVTVYGINLTAASVAGSGTALLATSIYASALSTTTWAIYTGTVALTATASYAWAWSICF
jgi:hypothetical protein